MSTPSTAATVLKIVFRWFAVLLALFCIYALVAYATDTPMPGLVNLPNILVLAYLIKFTIDEVQHLRNLRRNEAQPVRR